MRKLVLLRLFALPLVMVMLFSFLSISSVSAKSAQSSIKLHPDTTITCTYSPVNPFIGFINNVKYVIFEGSINCTGNWATATFTASGYSPNGSTQVASFTTTCTPNASSCSAWAGAPYVAGTIWQTQIGAVGTPVAGATYVFAGPTSSAWVSL